MFKRKEQLVTVSNDVGGFFANPEHVQHMYGMAGFNANIELVLMPYQVFFLNQLAKGNEIPFDVGGFHGQLGNTESFKDHEKGLPDWLLIHLFDSFLPKTIDHKRPFSQHSAMYRVEQAAQSLDKKLYLNVHQNAVTRNFDDYLIGVILINDKSVLATENGPGKADVAKTKDLIKRMKDRGGEHVDGTFDLVHALIGLIDGAVPDISLTTKNWGNAIGSIDRSFARLHIPIGKKAADSLPIIEMIKEKKMLRDLGQIVQANGLEITIENQHSLLFGATVWSEVERLKRIHDGLEESGIINY